jgi:hypothetical protein
MPLGKSKKTRMGMKLNRAYQLVVYADDIIAANHKYQNKNTDTLLDVCKKTGLKSKPALMFHHHSARLIYNIKTPNKPFENVKSTNIWE